MAQNDPLGGNHRNEGPPDLDEIWRRFLRRLRSARPETGPAPMGAPSGGKLPSLSPQTMGGSILGIAVLVWLLSGFYIVDAGRIGVVLRFGRFQETTNPGPHWHLPYPIEFQAAGSPLNVAQVRTVELGYRGSIKSKVLHESLMLTDDENLIDNQYAIQYTIKDPKDFLFNNRNPDEAVVQAAETAIREVVGRSKMDYVLYEGRSQIAADSAHLMQQILDRYKTGIAIGRVDMQNAQPPEQVQAAFDDAVKAGQDRDRQNNEGQAYANDVIPRARGAAARLIEESKAYQQRVVARATGDASRFKQVLTQYSKAPEVTRQRLYQDMMQQVLNNTSKVVAEQKSGAGNLLYLPLDKLIQATAAPTAPEPITNDGSVRGAASPPPVLAPASTPIVPAPPSPTTDEGDPLIRSRDAFRSRDRELRP